MAFPGGLADTIVMRARVWILVSLGLNLALAAGWFLATRPLVIRKLPPRQHVVTTNLIRLMRTNVVVNPRLLTWSDIESDDYQTYIQNLRSIGCPEPTIRDIIVADVDELYARRRAKEVPSVNQQWWRSDPDMDILQSAADKLQALDKERRALLTFLLGPKWEVGADPASLPNPSTTLDGPILGDLAPETKQAVHDIEARSREALAAYTRDQAKAGKPTDPAELARLREQMRDELAKVLDPTQLQEYLLRYSDHANQLRDTLRGFDATPDEFRGVFQATDALDQQLAALGNSTDPADVKLRQDLQKQRDQAVQQALGTQRYQFYQLNQDPAFQQARDTAQQLGTTPETVLPLYQINQATDQERQRILNDPTLTPEEQSQQLATIYQNQLDSLRRVLGEEAFRKYQGTLTK